jgi:hypothetical protein
MSKSRFPLMLLIAIFGVLIIGATGAQAQGIGPCGAYEINTSGVTATGILPMHVDITYFSGTNYTLNDVVGSNGTIGTNNLPSTSYLSQVKLTLQNGGIAVVDLSNPNANIPTGIPGVCLRVSVTTTACSCPGGCKFVINITQVAC